MLEGKTMALSQNISITLNAHKPKKDATWAVDGSHTTGATDITLWAASAVEVGNAQQVIGCFHKLHRWAQTELHNLTPSAGPTIVHMPLYAGDSEIEADGIPTSTECRIEVGATLVNKQQSHFIDRTFKRLIEVMLEVSKGTTPAAAAQGPAIGSGAQSNTSAAFQLSGNWPSGTHVVGRVTVWDPDSQEDEQDFDIAIPGGAPPEGWDAATAATVVAGVLDPMPHIRATVTGAVLTVTTADPDYTLAVSMSVEV